MAKKIQLDNLADEITDIVENYFDDVEDGIEVSADEVANEAVQELRATSPKKTGEYAKGWTKRKEKDKIIIHNKNKPGLAHLLEHGHQKRGGGRVEGKPHIRPVEEKVIKDYENVVIEVIQRGGK